MSYKIKSIKDGLIVTFSDYLNRELVTTANIAVYQKAKLQSFSYLIYDFSNIVEATISAEEIKLMSLTDKISSSFIVNIRLALVASNIHVIEILKEYRASYHTYETGWLIKIFNTLSEAKDWATSQAQCHNSPNNPF